MKKYVDIDKVINTKEIPTKLYEYENLMKEVPNFNHKPRGKKNF